MTILGSRASADAFPESLELIARGADPLPGGRHALRPRRGARVFARLDADPSALHKAVFVTEPA